VCLFASNKACGVVAANFETACAFGRNAVVFTGEADVCRFESFFEVRPYGGYEHHEAIFVGGFYAYTRGHAYFEGSDVE
jgi:hypothetical protein